jgi:PadR family transcriptional regulator, regulatory protein AphA
MIKFILLGLLNYQPMTGYDLKQTIDHSVSHFWHAYHSQIYTTLRQLESDGWVVSEFVYAESQPDRRVYALTDEGRREFTSWLNQSLTEMTPIKEELLVRVFFSARRDKKSVLAELYLQRELHQKKLSDYRGIAVGMFENPPEIAPELKDEAVFWRMTLNMGLSYEEMYINWLNQTIQEIEGSGSAR